MTGQTRHVVEFGGIEPRSAGPVKRPPQSGPRMHANERSGAKGHRSPNQRGANWNLVDDLSEIGRPARSRDRGALSCPENAGCAERPTPQCRR